MKMLTTMLHYCLFQIYTSLNSGYHVVFYEFVFHLYSSTALSLIINRKYNDTFLRTQILKLLYAIKQYICPCFLFFEIATRGLLMPFLLLICTIVQYHFDKSILQYLGNLFCKGMT